MHAGPVIGKNVEEDDDIVPSPSSEDESPSRDRSTSPCNINFKPSRIS